MPFESGQTLGRYTIERRLGSGAMGDVHLARDPRIDRPVALKTLRLATVRPGEMESMSERLLREARAAGRLIHPHIVTLFDAGEHDGLLYLAFEYVAGSDLAARLRNGPPLALGEALRIAGETCEGLAHAHAGGIVHRDVKPSNLLLTPEGRVKISDFGIAKLSGESQELTVSGTVMGSPHYLSPEQVRGEPLDGRSDLFSLGIVLYEMIAGRRPFDGETLTTLVYQILHKETPALPPLRAGLSPAVPELLAWFLAKDRDERVPDARTAADALARLAADLPRELLALPAVSHDEGTLLLDEEAVGSLRTLPPPPGAGVVGRAEAGAAADGAGSRGGAATIGVPEASGGAPGRTTPARGEQGTDVPGAAAGSAAVAPPAPPAGLSGGNVPSGSYAVPGTGARRSRWLLAAALAAGFVLFGGLVAAVVLLWPGDEAATAQAGGADAGLPGVGSGAGGEDGPAITAPTGPAASGPAGAPPSAGGGTGPERSGGAGQPPGAASATVPPATGRTSAPSPAPLPSAPLAEGSAPDSTDGPSAAPREPRPTPPSASSPAADPPSGSAQPGSPSSTSTGERTAAADPAPTTATAPRRLLGRPRSIGPADAFDETLVSGMHLVFRVRPDDAYVLLDGTVVGQARDFSPSARRVLDLPSAGEHTIVLRRAGMADRTIRVDARADGPAVTPLVGRLLPIAAAETPLHELETHRVGKAIGLRVTPPDARVLVDGRFVGAASQLSGGRMGRGEWLELPPGMHRVSLVAPGHRRVDLAIDVTSGALEERKRIQVVLPPDGSDGGR